MLVRVKFSKQGALKFIGHLDTMRYFQKVFSRSGLPLRFSQGFNPHPLMEFASPLGVGITSNGEYVDFELLSNFTETEIAEKISNALSEGIGLLKVSVPDDRVPGKKKISAMSLVDYADYLVYLKRPCSKDERQMLYDAFDSYIRNDKLPIILKAKTTERELDLKESIKAYGRNFAEFSESGKLLPEYASCFTCDIPETESGVYFYLRLSAGSSLNVKPEVFLEDFLEKMNLPFTEADFNRHRIDMYHLDERGLIPLWAVK